VGAQIGAQIGAATEFGTIPFSEQTTQLLADSGGMASTMQSIVASSSGSAAAAALRGKPLDQVLTAGFTGGINTLVTDQLMAAGYNPKDIDTQVIARAVASASGAVLQGQNVGEAITRSTVTTLAQSGMQAAADKIGSTYDQIKENSATLQGISKDFNETKAAAQQAWDNLTSYESTARDQAGQASSLLEQFNQQRNEVDSLTAQYNDKADLANSVSRQDAILSARGFNGSGMMWQGEERKIRLQAQAEAADLAGRITSVSNQANDTVNQFYATKAAYEDTVTNRLNPTKASYDGHIREMLRLGDQAVAISNETDKLGVTLGTAAGEYTVKQNELAVSLATEVAKTAGQDITTQLDTKKAEDAETSRVAQVAEDKRIADAKAIEDDKATQLAEDKKIADAKEAADLAKTQAADAEKAIREKATQEEQTLLAEKQKQEADALAQKQKAEDDKVTQLAEDKRIADAETARIAKEEDDARTKQLAEALANPTDTSQNPVSPVTAAITGTVSLNNDTIDESTGLSTVSVPKIQDAGGGFKYNEATGKYIDPTGKEITAEEYDSIKNPAELDPLLVDVAPEPLPKTDEDITSPLSILDTEKTDTTNPDAKVDTATDTTSPLSTLDTEKKDTTGPLSTLDTEKTDTTGPSFTGGSGDPGYDTYLALNPGNPLSFAQWKWQSQEPELGESDEWKQKYKEWQAQNPDLKAGTLDVLGEQDPSFDPWGNPEEDVTEEEPKEDPTKEDPTKLPSTKLPVPVPTTTTTTVPKITLPATTTKTTTTIPAATTTTKAAPSSAAPAASTDATGGIPNLTPGLTKAMNDYQLTGLSAIDTSPYEMASGGSTSAIDDLNSGKEYNPMATSSMAYLKPGLTRANLQYSLTGMPTPVTRKADGGEIMQDDPSIPEGHNPQFFSEGGLQNRYVRGEGDGTSDDVPAMLANGEFVIPADVVASLGNGDNDSGAKVLDEFLAVIRKHKRDADAKHLPPDSKGALGYLEEAHSKVRA